MAFSVNAAIKKNGNTVHFTAQASFLSDVYLGFNVVLNLLVI